MHAEPVRPAPAGLPPTRCPDCGVGLGPHDDVRVALRCACGGEVAAAFVGVDGRRLAVRAVFATTPEPACAACGGARRRVLVGTGAGVACDGCGVLVRRPRPPQRDSDARLSRRGLLAELALVLGIVGGAVVGVWWLWPLTAG